MKLQVVVFTIFLSFGARAEKFSFSSQSIHNLYASFIAIPNYLQSCLNNLEFCKLDKKEIELANKILNTSYKNEHLKTIEPGDGGEPFDMGDDQHRIAVTGSRAPSVIYLNSRFFIDEVTGEISQLQSLSILLHEMGHHFGIKDGRERELDIFAGKVSSYINNRTQNFNLARYNQPQIKVTFFNSLAENNTPLIPSFPIVTVSDGKSLEFFNSKISSQMICPYGSFYPNHIWANEVTLKALGDYNASKKLQPLYLGIQTGHHCRTQNEDDEIILGKPFNTSGYFRVNLKSNHPKLSHASEVSLDENSYFESIRLFKKFDEASIIINEAKLDKSSVSPGEEWTLKVKGLNFLENKWDVLPFCMARLKHRSSRASNIFGQSHLQSFGTICRFKKLGNQKFEVTIQGAFDPKSKNGTYELYSIDLNVSSRDDNEQQLLSKSLKDVKSISFKNSNYVEKRYDFDFQITNRLREGVIREPFERDADNPFSVHMPRYERVTFEIHSPRHVIVDSFYLKYDVHLKDGRILSRSKSHLRYSNYTMNNRPIIENNKNVFGSRYSLSSEEAGNFDLIDYISFKEVFIYTSANEEYKVDLAEDNHTLRIKGWSF